jgi:hypothetical protein
VAAVGLAVRRGQLRAALSERLALGRAAMGRVAMGRAAMGRAALGRGARRTSSVPLTARVPVFAHQFDNPEIIAVDSSFVVD